MCFVKNLTKSKPFDIQSAFNPVKSDQQEGSTHSIIEQEPITSSSTASSEKNQMMLLLHQLLKANSLAMNQTFQTLKNIQQDIQTQNEVLNTMVIQETNNFKKNKMVQNLTVHPFLEKIFGKRGYQYQLRLKNDLPQTLYKERNFNIEIELLDASGKLVRNSNLIPLYFAVCTNNGQWIHQNRQGQPMIKGKNEVQLLHGKALFQKIYLRDVTKPYFQEKFKFIVYAKPSVIKLQNKSVYDEEINNQLIMPMIFQDVTVLAKRKNCH